MSLVEIKIDDRQMAEIRRQLSGFPKAAPKILAAAINRTAKQARTDLVRDIAKNVTLKQKAIKSRVRMQAANRRRLAAGLYLDDKPLGLHLFSARQVKTGVSYRIGKQGKRGLLKHAFIRSMNNARLVWKRQAPGDAPDDRADRHTGGRPNVGRFPIAVQRGPGIRELFSGDPKIASRIQRSANAGLLGNVDAAIKRYLWARNKFKN